MRYCVESSKSFAEVIFDLEPIVQRLGFVTLHQGDLSESPRIKGSELDEDAAYFDIINYALAEKLLQRDISFALTLPWRICVHTDDGATWISILRPTQQFAGLNPSPTISALAGEIEARLVQIVDEVR